MGAIFPEGFEDFEETARNEGRSIMAHDILGIIARSLEDDTDTDWNSVIFEIIRYCREVRNEYVQKNQLKT